MKIVLKIANCGKNLKKMKYLIQFKMLLLLSNLKKND